MSTEVLAGYLTRPELCEQLGVVNRTINRYESEPNGLPFVFIGGRKLYRLESVRRWLEARETKPNPRRAA